LMMLRSPTKPSSILETRGLLLLGGLNAPGISQSPRHQVNICLRIVSLHCSIRRWRWNLSLRNQHWPLNVHNQYLKSYNRYLKSYNQYLRLYNQSKGCGDQGLHFRHSTAHFSDRSFHHNRAWPIRLHYFSALRAFCGAVKCHFW
jgi:hypothetical protein